MAHIDRSTWQCTFDAVEEGDAVAAALGPAVVHALQHGRPVHGIAAPSTCLPPLTCLSSPQRWSHGQKLTVHVHVLQAAVMQCCTARAGAV